MEPQRLVFKPGLVMHNGATVCLYRAVHKTAGFVLGLTHQGEYVTWRVEWTKDQTDYDTFSGSYFGFGSQSQELAMEDYLRRGGRSL